MVVRSLDRQHFKKAFCPLSLNSLLFYTGSNKCPNCKSLKGQRNQAQVRTQRSIVTDGLAAKCYLKGTKSFVEHSTLTHVILHQIGASLIYGLQYKFSITLTVPVLGMGVCADFNGR